ncbi:Hypothetical predicted protein [Paramuricea clavata]|uniref:Uncharacterized protein n=1 Tax=Paramuricea clavata TaxID=317549 RepID=A0A7D9I837_PARCT|nr:Hypothetical predicted protein [Paramuricea clavata]
MNENLIAVKGAKKVLTLNKPCYIGMCILDLSKTLMYDSPYNIIKKEYGDKAKLLFTVTDSLMYEIKTDYVYRDFKRIGDTTIEVPIIEVCESDKWTYIQEEYKECEIVRVENKPEVRVVVERIDPNTKSYKSIPDHTHRSHIVRLASQNLVVGIS